MIVETRAAILACRLHAGQVDKRGEPYADHLTAVVAILRARWPDAPSHALEAAWLHDAMEATKATGEELLEAGVSSSAVALLRTLARPWHLLYADWIACIAAIADPWVLRIKLAELIHDIEAARGIPGSELVVQRYGSAQAVLEAALADREISLWPC